MDETSGGELVGSGGFKVDRKKALALLKSQGSRDPDRFILSLARCAVLSGAPTLRLGLLEEDDPEGSGASSAIEAAFGGAPIGVATLEDPFSTLFSEAEAGTRRDFYVIRALLDLWGAGLEGFSLSSGAGEGRRVLLVDASGRESLANGGDSGEETVVRAWWRRGKGLRPSRVLSLLRSSCAESPLEISAGGFEDDEPFRKPRPSPGELPFELDGRRGRLRPAAGPGRDPGRLSIYHAGVRAEELELAGVWPPVEGFVDDPGLKLSFEGSAIVRDRAFEAMLACVAAQGRRLLSAAVEEQSRSLSELGSLLTGLESRRLWGAVLEGKIAEEPGYPDPAPLYRHAARTLWLRRCALSPEDRQDKDLWDAPLFFSTDGRAVSLQDLEKEGRSGRVKASRTYGSARPGSWTLWLDSSRTLSLLPPRLRDVLE